MPSEGELILRILLAGALGGALGAERELTEQPAGMRTHILVGLGAALFAVISGYGYQAIVGGASGNVQVDVSRVTAGIVSGIGFLGAGAILKYGASIRGLTTAASLWVTAAVGTAVGTGMLGIGAATTGMVLFALVGLRPLRRMLRRRARGRYELVVEADADVSLGELLRVLQESGAPPSGARVVRNPEEGALRVVADLPRSSRPGELAERLGAHPGVRSVDWG